jgi:hypothetical protein
MGLQVRINDRPANAKLSVADVAVGEKDEKNNEIVEDAVKEQSSGYQHLGELVPNRETGAVTVTEDHLKNDVKDVRKRRANNEPVIPTHYQIIKGQTVWILNEADAEAAAEGYICWDCDSGGGCLEWQKDPLAKLCNPLTSPGCGRRLRGKK